MNYSKALRVVRTARGLAQKDLAHRLGVEPAYLSMLEHGSRQPSRALLERFAHTTGLSAPLLGIAAKKRPVVLYERFLDGKKRCVGCAFANLAEFTPENGWCRVYDRPETGACERCGGSVSRPYALFLDDRRERPPTAGPWLHAKSSHDALAAIERYGMPGFLSLDFDLGTGEVTGATFLRELVETYWLPRYYRKVYLPIPPLHAHTSYPEGAAEMIELHRTWRQIPSLP